LSYTTPQPYFGTTFDYDELEGSAYRLTGLPYFSPQPHSTLDELKVVVRVVQEGLRGGVMLLDSSNGRFYPEVIACAVLALLPRRRRASIALAGDMWQPNTGLRSLLEQAIIRLADRSIARYFVFSSEEITLFPRMWGIDASKMRHLPYFASLTPEELAEPEPPQGHHVFAGGNANRNYRPLVEAARRLPDVEFVLATRRLDQVVNPPPNVRAGPITHAEFVRLMRSAAVVVVPIRSDLQRASGQQTYLNAMLLGKPVIVSQVFGLDDHVRNGVDALVVDGSAASYEAALRWVLDPVNASAVAALRHAAHEAVCQRHTFAHYLQRLQALMAELAAEHQAAQHRTG
jgi:glycosyltransferase involved in cell wall biosynthesis